MAINAKINIVLNTRKKLLVSDENIRIRDLLKDFRTPHVISSIFMPSICKLELVWPIYNLCKITKYFMNCIFALSIILSILIIVL